jgi:6-phosphogluconolactonase (cycloisomerase 2 family)
VHTFPPPGSDSRCLARVPMHPPSDAENALGAPMMSSEIILTNGNIVCTNRDSPNPEMDAIAIFAANDDGSLGTPSFIWPGMKHVRALSASPDDRFICVAGRDAGGLTVYDQRWNVRGRLDLDNVAIPVWME